MKASGSTPTFSSPDQAKVWLEKQGVKYVLAQFVDIHGVAKAKSVPVAHLGTILKEGAGFAGFAIWGMGMRDVVSSINFFSKVTQGFIEQTIHLIKRMAFALLQCIK